MSETKVDIVTEEKPPVGSVEGRPGVTVVTPENFNDYVDEKLGPKLVEDENADPEAVAKEELEKLEAEKKAPKEGDTDGSKVFFKGKWVGKHDFQYRLHLKGEEIRKESDAKTSAAEAKAKSEREARERLEKEAADLRAKYEPPKGDLGPEPLPSQFSDVTEYSKAIKEYTAEKTLREYNEKQANETQEKSRQETVRQFHERVAQAKKDIPDYEAKLANSDINVSDQLRDAIIESEVGPQLQVYLVDNPDHAERISKMTIGRMLREVGKIEATLGSQAKPAPKSEDSGTKPGIEVSQAPSPVTPLKGVNAPAGILKGSDEVPKNMTYDQWKKKWLAGQIK